MKFNLFFLKLMVTIIVIKIAEINAALLCPMIIEASKKDAIAP